MKLQVLSVYIFFFLLPGIALAVSSEFISDIGQDEEVMIEEPEIKRTYYGTLQSFPHTYAIQSDVPFRLTLHILLPDSTDSRKDISAIVVKELPGTGSIDVVGTLEPKDAGWEPRHTFATGDTFLVGPHWEGEVDSGRYRVVVGSPDNTAKYVLIVGSEEGERGVGYIELLRRTAETKVFFGKSQFLIVQSPYVYVPLLILLLVVGFIVFRTRKKYATAAAEEVL